MTGAEKRLLVVEDDEVSREWLVGFLRLEGYDVATAGDGAQALDYLRSNPPPDLILLDMLMPALDGWHFLEEIQDDVGQPQARVLVVTGTILTREWARDHSCAGLLRKPVRGDELLAEVQRCLAVA